MKLYFSIFIILFGGLIINAQGHIIELRNPSFESDPALGTYNRFSLPEWGDCAPFYFLNETPPDIHSKETNFFNVHREALDGKSFVGMVTRGSNETWEMISQKLNSPMLADKCYEFKIALARAEKYLSNEKGDTSKLHNFNIPVKLRIWGSNSACRKTQLLSESDPIAHTNWKQYTFKFKPKKNYIFILLEVFYKTPVLIPYNGNILLDNASDIIEIPCPDEEILASVDINLPIIPNTIKKPKPKKVVNKKPVTKGKESSIVIVSKVKNNSKKSEKNKPRKKILKKLNKKTIITGQTIRIKKLFFEADSFNIIPNSFDVLDEIYSFLLDNPNVIIEIGGHTNGVPGNNYCKMLSTERARNVANYLYEKGIPKYRIKYRGYGKSKPLASDLTYFGRKKNQRVEIKILRAR